MKDVVIIGAGLAGTLMAIRLAQRGHKVDLYEKRPDLRKTDISAGRSINLALSDRGLQALAMADLDDKAKELVIPMHGRMIHSIDGHKTLYRYSGREEDWINSISRPGLNSLLLDETEKYDGLQVYFDHDAARVDTINKDITIKTSDATAKLDVSDKIVIGADGAGSSLRREMQRRSNQLRYNFSQTFLDTGYKELCLPAGPDGTFQIEKNALHIWPRDGFMMIALPNLDASFTVTLFMRFDGPNGFDTIQSDDQIHALFDKNFKNVKNFFPDLIHEYRTNPSSSLGTIRCYPWQIDGQFLLIGDAAHAIVPFYGQGMNCSFEDCLILDRCIDADEGNWDAILKNFQSIRKQDADAIADLAEDNFYEMRDATADPVFNKKRQIELALEQEYPEYYSKYSLVTFKEEIPYHKAMALGRKQDEVLMKIAANTDDISQVDLAWVFETVKAVDG
ncbi:MAG: FAD-dependent monooxygenase [Saprospiraceae bacterium]|nr:FAD-dependent monooxygenase [Saprospiraceae bacterium]